MSQIHLTCIDIVTKATYREDIHVAYSKDLSICNTTLEIPKGDYVLTLNSDSKICVLANISIEVN